MLETLPIVVAENYEVERYLIQEYLQDEPFELHFASNCQDVLAKIDALDPALVIMDVTQRGLDARKVCEATETPMVFLSSLHLSEERRIRLKEASQQYLTKPYSRERLVGGVRKVLRLH